MPPLPGGLQMPAAGRGGPGVNPTTNPHASLLQALSASGLDQTGLKQQMQQQMQQQQQQQQRAPPLPGVGAAAAAAAPPPQPFPGGFPAAGFGISIFAWSWMSEFSPFSNLLCGAVMMGFV